MTHQVRGFVLRVAVNVKWYQLVTLSLAMAAIIHGAPIGGGGGN